MLACLAHARRALHGDDIEALDEIFSRIEGSAQRIEALDVAERQQMQPAFLVLLDEVARTINAFQLEQERVRAQLLSVNQGRAADVAYRRIEKP